MCVFVSTYVILNILGSFWNNDQTLKTIGFDGKSAPLGYDTANSGSSLPTFGHNFSVSSSMFKNPRRTPVTLIFILYSEDCRLG
jgi:hypothetical protein